MNAEILEEEHGAPIVESGLFKPGVTVEIGSDAGAKTVAERVRGVESVEHLVGDLRVARLIRPDEAETIAAEDGRESVKEKEEDETENDSYLGGGCPGGQASARRRLRIGRRRFHEFSLHVQNLSK